ncbi:hypothetical protein BDN67DRAFT_992531 [Paxillus ammoniavirescens]|nr:hypothetical protein BDN67DRAFT_992531 [Paxillus ammoniavirescens]
MVVPPCETSSADDRVASGMQQSEAWRWTRPTWPTGWLRSPAWIDGGVDPPRFYVSCEEIEETRAAALLRATVPPAGPSITATETMVATATGGTVPGPVQRPEPISGANSASGSKCYTICGFKCGTDVHAMTAAPPECVRHLVSISMAYSRAEKPASNRGKISRTDFIKAFLRVHDLADQYNPGIHFGPQFKLWWTGSSGGKNGASTIENDHDFEVARRALLKKKKDSCVVSIEFDVNTMDGKPILQVDQSNEHEELMYGTRVPRVDAFSEEAQIHGAVILQLKQKWACKKHLGEHGDVSHCYISLTGEHLGLNNWKLKMWAAAIAAADATKHEPPNTMDFDGLQDGRLDTMKPRGRTGPRSSASGSVPDPTTTLLAAVTSLIASQLAPKPPASSMVDPPSTPRHHQQEASLPVSPLPAPGSEIHTCLQDFLAQKSIDFCSAEDVLSQLELTPDIITDVPVSRLCEILSTVEGRALKFQAFSHEWNTRFQLKKRRLE